MIKYFTEEAVFGLNESIEVVEQLLENLINDSRTTYLHDCIFFTEENAPALALTYPEISEEFTEAFEIGDLYNCLMEDMSFDNGLYIDAEFLSDNIKLYFDEEFEQKFFVNPEEAEKEVMKMNLGYCATVLTAQANVEYNTQLDISELSKHGIEINEEDVLTHMFMMVD